MNLRISFEKAIAAEQDRLFGFIKRLGRKRLGYTPSPEDIVNQAVIYALERPHQFQDRTQQEIIAYLFWKTNRLIIDEARRNNAQLNIAKNYPGKQEDRGVSQTQLSTTGVLHRQFKQEAVLRFVEMIPEAEWREAIELVFFNNLSSRDAAAAMGKTAKEFRKLLRRGMRFLTTLATSLNASSYLTTGTTS